MSRKSASACLRLYKGCKACSMQVMPDCISQIDSKPLQDGSAAVFTACMAPDGLMFEAPAGLSLLEAAELAGLQPASSCRNGTCRACICQLSSGEVAYRIEWPGLSLEEKRDGYILPCAAYPLSDVVIRMPV